MRAPRTATALLACALLTSIGAAHASAQGDPAGCATRTTAPGRSEFWRDVACTDRDERGNVRGRASRARALANLGRGEAAAARSTRDARLRRAHRTNAIVALDAAHLRDPGNVDVTVELARLLADGDGTDAERARALALLAVVRQLDPGTRTVDVAFEVAVVHTRRREFDAAIAEYERGLAALVDPGDVEALTIRGNLAEVTMLSGDVERAVRFYEVARDEAARAGADGPLVLALWGLAVAVDRLGEHPAALRHAGDALDHGDGNMAILHHPDVFFEPPSEVYWYEALGHEALAARALEAPRRGAALLRAADAWRAYLDHGGAGARWGELARERLEAALAAARGDGAASLTAARR